MMKDRYEDEIEQILRELDAQPPGNNTPDSTASRPLTPVDDEPSPFAPKPPTRKRLISPSKLSIAGVVLAGAGVLLPVPIWFSLVGLAIIVVAVVWMFLQRMMTPNPPGWRGRPVDPPPQSAWQRFRLWLSR